MYKRINFTVKWKKKLRCRFTKGVIGYDPYSARFAKRDNIGADIIYGEFHWPEKSFEGMPIFTEI